MTEKQEQLFIASWKIRRDADDPETITLKLWSGDGESLLIAPEIYLDYRDILPFAMNLLRRLEGDV